MAIAILLVVLILLTRCVHMKHHKNDQGTLYMEMIGGRRPIKVRLYNLQYPPNYFKIVVTAEVATVDWIGKCFGIGKLRPDLRNVIIADNDNHSVINAADFCQIIIWRDDRYDRSYDKRME